MIVDASHDNSGKDPARQPLAAADIAAQVAAGNGAIVGVMLESFLVAGPPGAAARHSRSSTASRSPTPAWTGTPRSPCSTTLAAAVRARRAAVRIAVLGVGLIGGSIGLAARERGRRGGRLRAHAGAAGARARAGRDRRRGGLARARRSRAPTPASAARRWARCRSRSRRRWPRRDPTAWSPTSGSTKAALVATRRATRASSAGTRSPGAETAGVEHARADLFEGAVWYLTPHERSAGLLYERLHRLVRDLGARPVAIDARHPRPAARGCQPPAARARERARRPGRRAAARPGRGAAPGRAELPRRHPRGGRQHRDLDRHLPAPTARRSPPS